MSLTVIVVADIFDVWKIEFLRPFPKSFGNEYIILCVDYAFKWFEAIPRRTNEA